MGVDRFRISMGVVFKLYGKDVDAELIKIYWKFLKKFSIEEIENAISDYVEYDEKCEFMPKPGQLCQLIRESRMGNVKEIGRNEWANVYAGICKGRYHSDLPEVNSAIKLMGGWKSLREIKEGDYERKCNIFLECFEQAAESSYRKSLVQGVGNDTIQLPATI